MHYDAVDVLHIRLAQLAPIHQSHREAPRRRRPDLAFSVLQPRDVRQLLKRLLLLRRRHESMKASRRLLEQRHRRLQIQHLQKTSEVVVRHALQPIHVSLIVEHVAEHAVLRAQLHTTPAARRPVLEVVEKRQMVSNLVAHKVQHRLHVAARVDKVAVGKIGELVAQREVALLKGLLGGTLEAPVGCVDAFHDGPQEREPILELRSTDSERQGLQHSDELHGFRRSQNSHCTSAARRTDASGTILGAWRRIRCYSTCTSENHSISFRNSQDPYSFADDSEATTTVGRVGAHVVGLEGTEQDQSFDVCN